jgi:hypothetical protein
MDSAERVRDGKPGLAVAQSCLLRMVKALMKPQRVTAPE